MPGTDIYFILSIKQILDGIKWGALFIIIKQSVFVKGRVNSQAFRVFSYNSRHKRVICAKFGLNWPSYGGGDCFNVVNEFSLFHN